MAGDLAGGRSSRPGQPESQPGVQRPSWAAAAAADGALRHPRMTFPDLDSNAAIDVRRMAKLISEDLPQVGITVELDQVELGTFIANTVLPGNFEMAFFPNLPYDDPVRPLAFYYTQGVTGVGNWNNYTNPEIDELIDAQSEELDEAKRRELVHEVQRLMITEHGPQITPPSGYEYQARWSYVHCPYEIGEAMPGDAGPWGSDIWTEDT